MRVSEYLPKAYVRETSEDLDVDASNDGDYVVCNIHQDEIIYVFGTDFWRKEGGTSSFGWSGLVLKGYCPQCQKHLDINVGSYGG